MRARRILLTVGALAGLLFLALLGLNLLRATGTGVGQTVQFPDGSTFKLDRVAFTHTNFMYTYQTSSKLVQLLRPILPATFQNRWSYSGGSFGFGGDGNTNLHVVTLHRSPEIKTGSWSSSVGRLQI